MLQNKVNVRLVIRNDSQLAWKEKNPILLLGEMGIENDTGLIKVGDGSKNWNDLKYVNEQQNFLTDDKTIALENEILSLKNWGKEYYAWIEPVGEEGEENYIAGHYQKQIVDADHPWLAGLEPKASATSDGAIEIAWYQPSTMTIEGVNSTITSLQNTVLNLAESIGSIEDEAEANTIYGTINDLKEQNEEIKQTINGVLPLTGGALSGDLILKDGSTAASEAMVESKIANSIASAGLLKREIVESLPSLEEANKNTIYMIKEEEKNNYIEYILITSGENSYFEEIGNTSVDLTSYMKKVENATENNFAIFNSSGEVVDGQIGINSFVPVSHLEGFISHVTNEERENWNSKINGALLENNEEVQISEDHKLILPIAGEKLGLVKTSSADDQISVLEDGTMKINRISIGKLYVNEDEELILNGGAAN